MGAFCNFKLFFFINREKLEAELADIFISILHNKYI